ncbi:hypothetical protein VI08_11970 [Luteibacter yeojuensis]|uniref:Uncharacterized protein n=1 Tax=Luteibacter yeojuensis TaxID=345309 RepID=A0A0F3KMN7_9GAMM|nr:hypothetical protein VI08_11970 [Luteibacter yeojuensis]
MGRKAQEGTVARDMARDIGMLQRLRERRGRQAWHDGSAYGFARQALLVGMFGMERTQAFRQRVDERAPSQGVEYDMVVAGIEGDMREPGHHARHGGIGEAAVAREGPQAAGIRRDIE